MNQYELDTAKKLFADTLSQVRPKIKRTRIYKIDDCHVHHARIAELENQLKKFKETMIDVADKVRLELAKTYQDNVDNDVSRMYGNLDWMRLEGAVHVVQALKNFTKDNK